MRVYDPNKLTVLLHRKKLDYPDLARAVRIRTGHLCTTQTAKRWTAGTAPSANILRALADVLQVPMESFFSEE